MTMETMVCDSGLMLSATFRSLARDAQRVVTAESGAAFEASEVLSRIDRLRKEFGNQPEAPHVRWLESLRERVEAV